MKTQQNYRLNEEELAIIESALKQDKRPEVRQRAMAIHLLHQGQGPTEVAKVLCVTRRSIYNWVEQWQRAGLEGLANQPGRGRKRKATVSYCEQLEAALEQEPKAYGYGFALWTTDRLRQHLYQQTGVNLSNNRLGDLLKSLGYVYRRPKYALPEQAPETLAEFQAKLELVKKKPKPKKWNCSLWTKQP